MMSGACVTVCMLRCVLIEHPDGKMATEVMEPRHTAEGETSCHTPDPPPARKCPSADN
jgi:hypothetical protein